MSYVAMGETPAELFARRLAELRQAKTEEDKGLRPPAPKSEIKWWCWDYPGFKDCHPIAFRAAQADCEAQGHRDESACIVPLADRYSQACPCSKEPPEGSLFAGMTGTTWLLVGLGLAGAWIVLGGKKKAGTA